MSVLWIMLLLSTFSNIDLPLFSTCRFSLPKSWGHLSHLQLFSFIRAVALFHSIPAHLLVYGIDISTVCLVNQPNAWNLYTLCSACEAVDRLKFSALFRRMMVVVVCKFVRCVRIRVRCLHFISWPCENNHIYTRFLSTEESVSSSNFREVNLKLRGV